MMTRSTLDGGADAFVDGGTVAPEMAAGRGQPAPRWGFLLLRVSVVALVGVAGAISLDVYRQSNPDRPLLDFTSMALAFGVPESVLDHGLGADLFGTAAAPGAAATVVADLAPEPVPVPAATELSRAAEAAPAAGETATAPDPVAPAPLTEAVAAAGVGAVAAEQAETGQAATDRHLLDGVLDGAAVAASAPNPAAEPAAEPAPEPAGGVARRAAEAAAFDLRRPVLPSLPVEASAPSAQPTGPSDAAVSAEQRLALAAAVSPASTAAVADVEPVAIQDSIAPPVSAVPALALLGPVGERLLAVAAATSRLNVPESTPQAPPSSTDSAARAAAPIAGGRPDEAADGSADRLGAPAAGGMASAAAAASPALDPPEAEPPAAVAPSPLTAEALAAVSRTVASDPVLLAVDERAGQGAAPVSAHAAAADALPPVAPVPAFASAPAIAPPAEPAPAAPAAPVPEPAGAAAARSEILLAAVAGEETPDRGVIFAVEATRLTGVVARPLDETPEVTVAAARAEPAVLSVSTPAEGYAVTTAVSLLRPAFEPDDVSDADLRGRGLTPCEPGDEACRAFVAGEDGAFDKRSPVLARYGRNPLVLGGVELPLDPVEAERALRCLAFIAYSEAGNQGPRGMAAVIWVVMNRVANARFPEGPCEVIAQDGQFEPMTLGRYDEIAPVIRAGGMPPFLDSRGAERILQRTARLVLWQMLDGYYADDPTYGAEFFIAPAAMRALGRSMPDWTQRFPMTASIGDHSFYRRDNL